MTIFILQVHDQDRELQTLLKKLGVATKECEDLCGAVESRKEQSSQPNQTKGKLIYDSDDPHRPKFSLPELRDILQERNSLKARVSDLEDELAMYRPNRNAMYVFWYFVPMF